MVGVSGKEKHEAGEGVEWVVGKRYISPSPSPWVPRMGEGGEAGWICG